MRPDRLPRPLRLAIYGLAVAVILYVTLAPSESLPNPDVSDKFEHALAWGGLTGLGLVLSPRRFWQIGAFAVTLGAAVEVLQATLPFGRDGDVRDLVADSLGVVAVMVLWSLAVRLRRGV